MFLISEKYSQQSLTDIETIIFHLIDYLLENFKAIGIFKKVIIYNINVYMLEIRVLHLRIQI